MVVQSTVKQYAYYQIILPCMYRETDGHTRSLTLVDHNMRTIRLYLLWLAANCATIVVATATAVLVFFHKYAKVVEQGAQQLMALSNNIKMLFYLQPQLQFKGHLMHVHATRTVVGSLLTK